MDKGRIQQIGSPADIYNEPENAFVADFIGESNILDGIMRKDFLVEIYVPCRKLWNINLFYLFCSLLSFNN